MKLPALRILTVLAASLLFCPLIVPAQETGGGNTVAGGRQGTGVQVPYGQSSTIGSGPLIDALDGQPLKWRLADADGPAEVRAHWLDADGGMDRRPCEALTLNVGHGTRVELEYRIPPSRVIEDVRATVSVKCIRNGPRIGLRLRYPRVLDPATKAPKSVIVWGQTHGGRDRWEMLSVSPTASVRHQAEMSLRQQFGPSVDLRDAYIEALVINAYAGAGAYTIRLDELRVDGLMAMDVNARAEAFRASGMEYFPGGTANLDRLPLTPAFDIARTYSAVQTAFPTGRITRVIQYNGESLQYLKMLGFDAILLARPPTIGILGQATEHSMIIYGPPPESKDENLEPLLNVVGGWYLGTSTDERQLRLAASDQKRLETYGPLWNKPLMVAPAECWDLYAGVATTMIYDLPPYVRGLSGREEVDLLIDQVARTGRPVVKAVGVASLPPSRLVNQIDSLGRSVGAVAVEDYGWRWMWLQTIRGLTIAPRAVIFRSGRSLEEGSELAARRSSVMGLVNQWLDVVGPLVSSCHFRGTLVSSRSDYKLAHLASERAELVIATHHYNLASSDPFVFGYEDRVRSPAANNSIPNRYDVSETQTDQPLVFRLPVGANNFAWRITHATVEQLPLSGDAATREAVIENPDLVEWIVTSNDPGFGASMQRVLRANVAQIARYRWDLVSQALLRTREDWRSSVGGGLVGRMAAPNDLMRSAANLLSDAQRQIVTGEYAAALRATRAADQMTLRCEAMLAGRLRLGASSPQSLPTQLAPGATSLQLAWLPSLQDGRWSNNLLAGGELDDSQTLVQTGWTYQTRLPDQATAAVGIEKLVGESGSGGLRLESSGVGTRPLAGGYAGTVARVSSSSILFEPGSWVRIQARVRTLGFGGPNQGLLIYDSEAGSEIGTLVRGNTPWNTVLMYRVITSSTPFRVTLESIGGGEAVVDWVSVEMWQPPLPAPQFRPITPN